MIKELINKFKKSKEDINENNLKINSNDMKNYCDSLKAIDICICNNKDFIRFEYRYGEYKQFINDKEIKKSQGFTYKEFLDDVIYQYPLNTIKSFRLIDISK